MGAEKLIYFVDDNGPYRQLISTYFKKNNLNIKSFDCPSKLLVELGRGREPDMILSDLMMPYMSGIELFREINQKYSLKSIFSILTSQNQVEKVISSFDQGVDHYLIKDIGIDIITEKVFTILHNNQSEFDVRATMLNPSETKHLKMVSLKGDEVILETNEDFPTNGVINLFFKGQKNYTLWRVVDVKNEGDSNLIKLIKIYENER